MIELFRKAHCDFSDDIVAQLKEMVLAHQIHIVPDQDVEDPLPFVKEGTRVYQTREEIRVLLAQINREMIVQREMQSDSCKIDPDTGEGCL